ncbi:hypothetical protein D3C80_1160730 [compost metagenome]
MAQVDALFLVLLFDFRLELAGFLEHGLWPYVGDIVRAQGHVDFHARRHVVADYFDNVALGLEARRWPVGDLHLDELANLGSGIAPRGDQHFLLDLGVVGGHKANSAFFEVAANNGFMGPGNDFDDHAFAAAAAVQAGNPGQGAVAIEHQAHLPWA